MRQLTQVFLSRVVRESAEIESEIATFPFGVGVVTFLVDIDNEHASVDVIIGEKGWHV